MPLACRFCLGSFFSISLFCDYGKLEAFHFAFVTGWILDGRLDKPGPLGVGEV